MLWSEMATELIVHSMPMIEVAGETNIPTVLAYMSGKTAVGQEAINLSKSSNLILNEDFKIDLGNYEPSRVQRKRFMTGSGDEKSAAELTSDFLTVIISKTREWLAFHGLSVAPSILLAEPLKDPKRPEWIQNYRANIERILSGKGFEKKQIDFLPEPFAVFQFYRYGYRHPGLADKRSYRALVLDFGGGTFDTCIVETKKDGDISQSGKNSSPLGASSTPIGGFEINRQIAEHIAIKIHETQDSKVKKGIDIYKKWRRDQEDLSSYSQDYKNFVRNFDRLVHEVESSKVVLSKNIGDWNLNVIHTFSVPVKSPKDLFDSVAIFHTVHLKASEVQKIFCSKIWPRLHEAIKSTIAAAKEDLGENVINAVLLSGGSCSFGWIKNLLLRDFASEIKDANILTLSGYQEIVAKGLAIECARRYYVEQGDFGSTTYNRLCLTLDSGDGQDLPKYSPRFTSDKVSLPEGVLVPASTALGDFIDRPLRWKFRLGHPPTQKLDYYFLRSSFDPDDTVNLQNIEEQTVFTPPKTIFDSQLQVELTVTQDGTAHPKFIYKTGSSGNDSVIAEGRPFYLDMTNVGSKQTSSAYIGIDFGTSNSAVSFLNRESMDLLRARSADVDWLTLNDLITSLPYPLARTLNRFLGGTSSVNSHESFMRALEFVEAAFGLLAYTAYSELCTLNPDKTRYFKGFTQRSVGPLWGLLRDSLTALSKKATIVAPAMKLIEPKALGDIDKIVKWFGQRKHQKATDDEINLTNAIGFIGNICNDVYKTAFFGYFENVQRVRFGKGYFGRFRIAHGPTQPFPLWVKYVGQETFSDFQPFLLDVSRSELLGLEPLAFWDACIQHSGIEEPHFFLYDRAQHGGFDFKALGYDCSVHIDSSSKYEALADELTAWRETDPKILKIPVDEIIHSETD
jgi:hypothetical protein